MYGWGLVVILSHVLFYCGCSEINGTTGHNLEHSTKIPKSTEHTTSAPVVADQENFKFFAGIFFRDDHVCCELTAAMSSLQFGGKGGAFVQVVLTVNHEKYGDDGGLYDISMLQLKQPFTLSSTIGIITLATKVDYTIKTCHLYGWNLTEKPKHVTINYSSPLEFVHTHHFVPVWPILVHH
ncbi:Trypsin [Popillia japonica]|uniref:Trypsin n=1 Tax=Popillia japonica TaxID=7064 RepID=A0AAW1K021_POPJA